jgi:uncharacterized protein (DUF608 family)
MQKILMDDLRIVTTDTSTSHDTKVALRRCYTSTINWKTDPEDMKPRLVAQVYVTFELIEEAGAEFDEKLQKMVRERIQVDLDEMNCDGAFVGRQPDNEVHTMRLSMGLETVL